MEFMPVWNLVSFCRFWPIIWFNLNTVVLQQLHVFIHMYVLTMKVWLTSSRGISPFLQSLGQGIINLPQTVRCDSSCSTVMGILQKSHLTSLLGHSSCKWALNMDFSNSFPHRLGHMTGTNLHSSKWACKIRVSKSPYKVYGSTCISH